MARRDDSGLRGDFPVPQGYLDDNRFITPGITRGGPPELTRLPTLAEMKGLDKAGLMRVLNHYGITQPYGLMQAEAMDYVRRMMPLRTPDEIQAAYQDLLENEERRLLGITRRVSQQWSTLDAIDGDQDKELIWIAEDDEATCENCAPRSGEIDTWAGWKQRGMPGSSVCRGGDYCRCDLVVIE